MRQEIKRLQFVQQDGLGVDGFGIVEEVNQETKIAIVMPAYMDESFGCIDCSLNELTVLDEEKVRESLSEVANDVEKFAYFIIQLNDIEELKDYHIEENALIKEIRETNEVLN